MTDKKENKTPPPRTQVKDLPKQKQELSKSEQKKIKGGPRTAFFFPSISRTDGSGN